jgi:hypothetical protein
VSRSPHRLVVPVLAVLLVAPPLAAQHPGSAAAASATDSVSPSAPPLVTAESAGRMRAMKWLYVASLVNGEGSTPQRLGFRTLELSPTSYRGAPAWLLIDSRQMHTATLAESLYVAKADLAPLRRIQRTPEMRVVSDFAADSIRTTFDGDTSHVAVAMANQPGLIANVYLLEVMLGTTPLRAGWSGGARLAAIGENGSGVVPITERIVGQETVRVPDGAFDCWTVELTAGASAERFWVRKSDGVVIRERIPVIGMDGSYLELILALDGAK